MRQVKTISKETIKYILKIIYKITRSYCIWYKHNFPDRVIDWDRLFDEWNDLMETGDIRSYSVDDILENIDDELL